ncbi:MAG: hypothetical protein MK102_11760 [Fuerstiella sp.]|nr:hypothetical protein [Fuerstiella sp.]
MFNRPWRQILLTLVLCNPAQSEDISHQQRDKEFSERMATTVLIGSFTIDGQKSKTAPKEERYEINSVEKSTGGLWIFTARVKYMKFDATLPIPVPVEWAGDTPVVTLTDARLPGLGEGFSCRVIFHNDRYAGTWQHGAIGGHMFGRIEKQQKKKHSTSSAAVETQEPTK